MIKKVVRNLEDLKLLYDTLKPLKMLGCDVETTALELDKMKLLGIGIGTNTKMFYVPWDYPGLKNEDTIKVLNSLFKKPIIFHNAKFDMKVLTKFGFKEPADVHDTLILSWLSDETTNNGLKFLAKNLLNRDNVVEFKTVEKKIKEWEAKRETPDLYEGGADYIDEDLIDEVGHYCMDDVRNTCDLYVFFKKQLVKEGIWDAYIKLEKPMIKVLNKMESVGVKIDKEWLTTKRDLAAQMLVDLETQMYTLIGKTKEEFNLNSPKQLEVLLFDELKYLPIKKTASGKRSTDNEVLNQLVKVNNLTDNDFVPLFLKYREMDKLHKTYLIGMLDQGGEDGIIHASFLQHGTRTGRLSCVPLTTKIFTDSGWKTYNQLHIGERVLGFSLNEKRYVWTRLKKVHKGTGTVGMIKINQGHDPKYKRGLLSTANHRWIVKNKKIIGFCEAAKIPRNFDTLILPKADVPDLYSGSILTEKEAFIWGWYLTDGAVVKSGTNNISYGLQIGVRKKRSIAILDKGLKGIPHSKNRYKQKDGHYVTQYYLGTNIFNPIYKKLGQISPEELVLQMDRNSRQSMFSAMLEGDGSMRGEKKRYDRFGALEHSDKPVCAIFELLCLFLNQPYTFRKYKLPITGKTFIEYNLGVRELLADRNSSWSPIEEVAVWCPETEVGTWVMLEGHQIAITGNSREPNLQNIPARHDEWDIRQAFIPREGHKFIVSDYSQIELRVLAHFSKDENMVQAFNEDFDIHAKTMEVTGITERRIAKAINFGLIYGMGPRSLAHGLGITEKEAEKYIELFFKGYPKVRPFIKSVQRFVKQNWYIPMLTGRRRRFIEEASRNWYSTVERQSINTKIQGSAADIMKIAMLKMDKVLPEFRARQLIQVHDEIIVEAPAEIIDDAAIAVQLTMEQAVKLSVPLKVGMQIGDYWVK